MTPLTNTEIKSLSAGAQTLILANLTALDFKRFSKAAIPYTGSTGAGGKPEVYGEFGPYIATYRRELSRVIHAMRWKKVVVTTGKFQWIARKPRKADHD